MFSSLIVHNPFISHGLLNQLPPVIPIPCSNQPVPNAWIFVLPCFQVQCRTSFIVFLGVSIGRMRAPCSPHLSLPRQMKDTQVPRYTSYSFKFVFHLHNSPVFNPATLDRCIFLSYIKSNFSSNLEIVYVSNHMSTLVI